MDILPNLVAFGSKARSLAALGQVDQAEAVARMAAHKTASKYGPESQMSFLANTLHARMLHFKGDFDESKEMLQKTLPAQTRLLGPDHPETRVTAGLLATLFENT